MMCDNCGKKPSKFHMTESINGNSKEIHLCEDCAKLNQESKLNSPFTIHNLLAGLFDLPADTGTTSPNTGDMSCNKCSTSYEEFKESGKFDCSKCYESLSEELIPLLRKIHGHDTHTGKIPKRAGGDILVRKQIDSLRSKLNRAVMHEEFEMAAQLRDEIKKLQQDLNG